MTSISVVVVDDHDLLREGVSACLASYDDLEVVGEAANGEDALAIVETLRPDVIVVDLVMPGLGGVEVIRRLRAGGATLGIVALSSFSEVDRIREVIDAGANSYLVKSVDATSLAAAVHGAAVGHGTFSPEVTRALLDRREPTDISSLTAREREIALLLAGGRTNSEIASHLELSIFTVKNHVSSILMKLHAQTRTEAASVILRAGDPSL
jgi:two-component system, NarL family, response regulator LiaR